jgi:hypothetical protein
MSEGRTGKHDSGETSDKAGSGYGGRHSDTSGHPTRTPNPLGDGYKPPGASGGKT